MCNVFERCINKLRGPAIDPEDASSEVVVVRMNKINQWFKCFHSRRATENLMEKMMMNRESKTGLYYCS